MSFFDIWNKGLFTIMGSDKSIWVLIIGWVLCAVFAYLIGSLNFGCIISIYKFKDDVRKHGSGNAGATNIFRTYGKGAALCTYLGDGLKAAVAVVIGHLLGGVTGGYIAGLFTVIGHMWPVFFGFKGGKGVATASVMILCLNPIVFLIMAVIFIIIVWSTKYISLGSIVALMLYPLLLFKLQNPELMGGGGQYVIIAFIVAILVVFKHRSNIKRIMAGNENKFVLKTKKKSDKNLDNTVEDEEKSEDK
ncbi:MAG: glycerol-3-phosphate 1-O-acyltransferase PlsY [Clostridia bacterium]|nr:glycerol-3-phosphate 1-O-acyltransferase PlsY [Clostridia bacterium]